MVWRKLEPLFNRNKKLYASKEVKENALASEGKSCRPETKTTVNRYVCHDLSVWNKRLKSHLLSENVEPSRASTQQRKKTYWNKQHFAWGKSRVGLPPPFIAAHPRHLNLMQNAFIMFTTADFILFLTNLPVAWRGKPRERYSLLFRAEKRSAQASAHTLS